MTIEEARLEEKYFICKVCGNGYTDSDVLELHLRKEHTKTDFIAWLKREACNNRLKELETCLSV